MLKYNYIAFEGVDGVGKTTQIELLKKELKNAIFTKEPGSTEIGTKIRNLILNNTLPPKTNLFLFLADRSFHIEKVIKPNYGKKLIISDRSLFSGIGYNLEDKKDFEFLLKLNIFATDNILPDFVIFFKATKELLEKRLNKKLDSIEKKGIFYLLKVQENIEFVIKNSGVEYLTIDALESKELIFKKIKSILTSKKRNWNV